MTASVRSSEIRPGTADAIVIGHDSCRHRRPGPTYVRREVERKCTGAASSSDGQPGRRLAQEDDHRHVTPSWSARGPRPATAGRVEPGHPHRGAHGRSRNGGYWSVMSRNAYALTRFIQRPT